MSSSRTPRLYRSTGSLPHAAIALRYTRSASARRPASCSSRPRLMWASRCTGSAARARSYACRAASASSPSRSWPRPNQSSAPAAGARSFPSITLKEPSAGSPSNASRYCPESACQRPAPSFTTTRSPTAPMLSPDKGMSSGRWRRSSLSERVIRFAGTLAAASAWAVRRTIRSWNENRKVLRAPRAGETKPALTRLRIVLRGRRSSFSTSRTPYCCMAGRPVFALPVELFPRSLFHSRLSGFSRALGRLARFGLLRRLSRFRGCAGFLVQARAQRLHEVDDLRAAFGLFGHRDLLAFHFLLHRGFDPRAHFVGVQGGIEFVGSLLLDQLLRELQLRLLHFGLRDLDLLDRPHLAGVEQLLHDEALLDRADHHDVLLAAGAPAAERAAAGIAQRPREQRVRLRSALVRGEVVGLVEEHRVDRIDRHEFRDVRRVRTGFLERLQLFRREHHVLILGELVALRHVLACDRDLLLHADVLLLEPRSAGLVQQVERDRAARLGGGVKLHRNRHQSKGNGQRCNRSCSHACPPACIPFDEGGSRFYAFARSSARSRLCLRVRASRQRSPVPARRSATLVILKSSGCALASSSQVSGIDTGAPGAPRGE